MARPRGHPKSGGRKKGTPNKKTAEFIAAAEASGEMPREYLLRIMRDDSNDIHVRMAGAKAAAPYCHPTLSSAAWTDPGGTGPEKIVIEFVRAEDGRPVSDLPVNLHDRSCRCASP
jgi:hypothetical protein